MEIDEYRDYEKALGALREAEVHLNKGGRVQGKDSKLALLQTRIAQVDARVTLTLTLRATLTLTGYPSGDPDPNPHHNPHPHPHPNPLTLTLTLSGRRLRERAEDGQDRTRDHGIYIHIQCVHMHI